MNGEGCIEEIGADAVPPITFESLVSVSRRTPFMDEMRANIYDQTDMHRGYISEGMDDGPSPEMVERSLHRMALRCSIPSLNRDGEVRETMIYVAAVDASQIEKIGLHPGKVLYMDDGILSVYDDDGLDMMPGSHDVFELISDLEDLFLRLTARSLTDIGYLDEEEKLLFLLRLCPDGECQELIRIDTGPIAGRWPMKELLVHGNKDRHLPRSVLDHLSR